MKTINVILLLLLATITPTLKAQSFKPGEVWLDNNGVAINAHGGGVLYHEGTYYWYGEHKIEGKAGNVAMEGVHCYSSTDLYNWNDEGIVLSVSDDEKSDITKGCIIERPKVIYNKKTKKFVMWFHLEIKSMGYLAARSGVAVCDTPMGAFEYKNSVNPNAGYWPQNLDESKRIIPNDNETKGRFTKKGNGDRLSLVEQNLVGRDFEAGQMARDMTLFVDDDGTAYHIYSSEENTTTQIARLSDDYLSHTGEYVQAFPRRWMEAPAMCKRKGVYHFLASGCSGWAPNTARAGAARNPFGAWLEQDNPCIGRNEIDGMDASKTFGGQSTFILKVEGMKDAYIALFDIWQPDNAIAGRYVWLPMTFNDKLNTYTITWMPEWDLSIFKK